LLQQGLHVRDHLVRRFSAVTHIDRCIVGIIFGPVPAVTFNQNYRIQGSEQWQGPQYEVFRSYHPERHDQGWYRSHYNRVELFGGGYYYWNNGYSYPAWGYDPLLRLWLRAEVRVLRFDLLHLLRIRLLRCACPRFGSTLRSIQINRAPSQTSTSTAPIRKR
jgi:hypothetical protein